VGRVIGLVLALSVWTTYQRLDAAHEAKAACEQGHLEAQIAELQRQLAVARQIEQNAVKRADRALAEMTELREASGELAKIVAETPAADCGIPPDIRDRLRAIR
jgi:hypothetical protein